MGDEAVGLEVKSTYQDLSLDLVIVLVRSGSTLVAVEDAACRRSGLARPGPQQLAQTTLTRLARPDPDSGHQLGGQNSWIPRPSATKPAPRPAEMAADPRSGPRRAAERPASLTCCDAGRCQYTIGMVREGGVEPPRPFGHTDLNRARLPIPPLALGVPEAGDALPDSVRSAVLIRCGSRRRG